ncbi:MAG: DUF58 domain-containing protein [Pirellulales bacterium]
MSTRRQVRLTREGWYYAIVLSFIVGGAVLREVNLLFVLAAVMMGPLFFSWRLARLMLGRLRLRRRLPSRAHAGETVSVQWTCRNDRSGSSSWAIAVSDQWRIVGDFQTPPREETAFFTHVGALSDATSGYSWMPPARGRYAFERVRASTRFPFGFLEARSEMQIPGEVLVAPRLGRLTPAWRRWVEQAALGDRASSQRRGVYAGDYYGLREWRPGDSRRWIHWRSSARQGNLTTLQFEDPRREDILLLVDLWTPSQPSAADRERVEAALSMAATVLVEFSRHRSCTLRCGLAGVAARSWSTPATAGTRQEMLDAMAEIQPTTHPDWRKALPRLPHGGGRGRIVVISTRSPPPETAQMLASAEEGAGRRSGTGPFWIEMGTSTAAEFFEAQPSASSGDAADAGETQA